MGARIGFRGRECGKAVDTGGQHVRVSGEVRESVSRGHCTRVLYRSGSFRMGVV